MALPAILLYVSMCLSQDVSNHIVKVLCLLRKQSLTVNISVH